MKRAKFQIVQDASVMAYWLHIVTCKHYTPYREAR